MVHELQVRPSFSPEEAVRIASHHFALAVSGAEGLPSDRDQNFLLHEEGSGRKYVLKFARSGEERETLDFQNRMLEHLARGGFTLSKVIHDAKGNEIVEIPGPRGRTFFTRVLTWVPGKLLWQVNPQSPDLFRSLGSYMGGMDKALEGFSHPAQSRDLHWDLRAAGRVVGSYLQHIENPGRRALLEASAARFLEKLGPLVTELRMSVIHGDANDHNVLVNLPSVGMSPHERRVIGVLDFGDSVRSFTVGEAAIAGVYAMCGKRDPFTVASQVVEGYHRAYPISESEAAALLPLMGLRLCASVAIAAHQKRLEPENGYLTVSEESAWSLLELMAGESQEFPHFLFRKACGFEPVPGAGDVAWWLEENGKKAAPIIAGVPTSFIGGLQSFSGPGGTPSTQPKEPQEGGAAKPLDLSRTPLHVFDLSVDSAEFGVTPEPHDALGWTDILFRKMKAMGAEVGVGRYDEVRRWYTSDIFLAPTDQGDEWRTVHLGIDLFVDAGSQVFSPFDAVVHSVQRNEGDLDYGPTLILEHRVEDNPSDHGDAPGRAGDSGGGGAQAGGSLRFWTLYGHLAEDVLTGLAPGQAIKRGQPIARIGSFPVNGNWAPHLHFQVLTDTLGFRGNFPGVCRPSQREIWKALSPDPNLILGMSDPGAGETSVASAVLFPERPGPSEPGRPSGVSLSTQRGAPREELLSARRRHLGPSLSISYDEPLKIVRGLGQFLFDEEGQAYLDCVNNVPNVGHSHPKVVEAGRRQMAVLNTNTRYLHDLLVEYAQRLVSLLPEPLSKVYFVNSGSEANELALRMARAHTKRKDVLVVDGAYHGNTAAMVDLSPYKFDGPGGEGRRSWVHKLPMPDPFRGLYRAFPEEEFLAGLPVAPTASTPDAGGRDPEPEYMAAEDVGPRYAQEVRKTLDLMRSEARVPAAFFCESMLGCGGQIVLPDGFLTEAFEMVRLAGGVCVADEVQVGFGRAGTHFWAFETQGVVPDIVTLGKPMGNGHPIGAVVTTPEIAGSFKTGMEFFSTYGGNPVSCAVGLAVLDVIDEEGLQENAREVGEHLLAGLNGLKARYPLIGDVRGLGLYIGVELVKDPKSREPATTLAHRVKERLREYRLLLSTDGPQENVLKIKPPIMFTLADADRLVETLGRVLEEEEFQL